MTESPVPKRQLFDSLPPIWPESLLESIRARVNASGARLAVLDDDPTGTQTVHSLPVLTEWPVEALARELAQSPVFYILTNSRALERDAAVVLAKEIGRNLKEASRRSGHAFAVASRSDSTLRGHFPAEVDALGEALAGGKSAGLASYVLTPYFAEGGRFTIGDVHYVLQGDTLVPAAQTEFAKDKVFGYRHSRLPDWVEEKTSGRVQAKDVVCITLDDLRKGGPGAVASKLKTAPEGGAVIVNSAADRDMEVFVAGLLDAEAVGRRFLYRTAASFVRIRGGIATKPLLTAAETRGGGDAGGLVVVGSFVARSSEQLSAALGLPGVHAVELSVDALLAEASGGANSETDRAEREVSRRLRNREDVILYTSRALRTGATAAETLAIGQRVSRALCAIVRGLEARPRFLIAKGGITSSDVATQGLGVKRALVLGQLLPGVPVWELGPESKFPGMRYVVFPGNVGGPDSVAEAIRLFHRS
jgi:uncharacterized protein YgbK (DUF1537 family)